MTQTQQVLDAADALVRAFGRHDTDAYFASFAPQATFLFHTLPQRLDSRDAYRAVWQGWEREADFRVIRCESSDRQVQWVGEAALFTHTVNTVVAIDGVEQALRERETIVFQRDADQRWLAVHEHLSPLPQE
ncbi:nuclear transport factor 2 family protein [Crenobacter sp. SG2303]|uniref:Nuclear transport factor 2 family protein n=1 Tax=Crenobacter oryzisoli TaxID=3056844 RepID=A0ABT7XJF6_9NEIS|nr:nuclear transport factor 2 family protein [Crenobacter sp. SG2303]MDN0073903.1 nuclear transport factor 2 family protein [Crenobacter sp. SG2303]